MSENKLHLEILSGPLDGTAITLETEAQWSCTGEGPLIFPWDEELGEPQAVFSLDEEGWHLEGLPSPRGTYRVNRGEQLEGKIVLEEGDLLKAANTWLLVRDIS